jgi:HPt (histidine-containing phosphotransfer) domain-containing protein
MTPVPNLCTSPGAVSSSRQVPDSSASAALDLEGLRARCLGNIDLVQRVLHKFEQLLPEALAELEAGLDLEDAERIARVAHRIKGNSANVSAKGLQQAAAEIEDLSHSGRLTDIPLSFERLRAEWDRYLDYASTLLSAAETM